MARVQLVIGLAIGTAGAFGVGKLLESLLVQTGTRDPVTLTSIVALLVIVSLAACFWPARRGSIRSARSAASDAGFTLWPTLAGRESA